MEIGRSLSSSKVEEGDMVGIWGARRTAMMLRHDGLLAAMEYRQTQAYAKTNVKVWRRIHLDGVRECRRRKRHCASDLSCQQIRGVATQALRLFMARTAVLSLTMGPPEREASVIIYSSISFLVSIRQPCRSQVALRRQLRMAYSVLRL